MRRHGWIMVVLLLTSSVCAAQGKRGPSPLGRPTALAPTAPPAYWIWVDPDGLWHVRTTTPKAVKVFEGTVKVEDPGVLTELKPTQLQWGDTIRRLTPRQILFRFRTMGAIDGFDFRASAPFVRFDVYIDGGAHLSKIFIGKGNVRPASQPFDLYGPSPQPVPPPPEKRPTPPPTPPKPEKSQPTKPTPKASPSADECPTSHACGRGTSPVSSAAAR